MDEQLAAGFFPATSIRRTIVPLRLLFWGIILHLVDLKVNGFDLVNDSVGILMILWGTVFLSRIPPFVHFRRRMLFLFILAVFATVFSFCNEVAFLFQYEWMPPPSTPVFASVLLGFLTMFGTMLVFGNCMKEYSSIMQWETVLGSWKCSARLLFFGVFLPTLILFAPLCFFFGSLKFTPKKTLPISWTTRFQGDEMTITASRDGEIIYSETLPKPQIGQSYSFPNLDQPQRDGVTFDFGEWSAPIDGLSAQVGSLVLLAMFVFFFWAIIHFLISLSRTIRAAENSAVS